MPKLLLLSLFTLASASAVPIKDNTLSGKIVDWPADLKGEVRVVSWYNNYTFGTAPVDAQGHFKLELRDQRDNTTSLVKVSELLGQKSIFGNDCEGSGKATPDTGFFQDLQVQVWTEQGRYGDLTLDSSAALAVTTGDSAASLMYFSELTTLEGQIKCPFAGDSAAYHGQYPAGWNLVRASLAPAAWGGTVYTYNSAASLTGLSWRLFKEFGGVGITLLDKTNVISTLNAGMPAEKAGLQFGDEIVGVDGRTVNNADEVVRLIRGAAGSKVTLTVKRAGKEIKFTLTRAVVRVP